MTALGYRYSDGGRSVAGFEGEADDCVVRAIAVAAEIPYRVDHDDLYPRDDEHRYRLYALRDGHPHVVVATGSPAGVGSALVTVAREQKAAGLDPEVFAVYDAVDRCWLSTFWQPQAVAR